MISTISDDRKVDCLKSLIENWNLVKWIRTFRSMSLNCSMIVTILFCYTGVKGMYTFVDVAFTATDDVISTTLLTDLRTVAKAVGKLLFQLPEPCSLNDLVTACDALWLESSSLPALLVNSSSSVD